MTTPLAEVFQPLFSGLEEQNLSGTTDNPFHQCFGCGPSHPTGLRIRTFKTADGVLSPIIVSKTYEGPPGAAHGGIVAAYLDEVLVGAVKHATTRLSVTGELTVRYRRPVPTERPIIGRGSLVADHGRYVDVEGRLEDLETGEIFASAKGRFFPIPMENAGR